MSETVTHGPLKVTQVDGEEEGVDIEIAEDIDINLGIRRELVEGEEDRARLIVEGDIVSVDIAFVILTQSLGVPDEDITAAVDKAREAE